jgi:hypothetical protein
MLRRLLIVATVALALTALAGIGHAQVGLPVIICKNQAVPPGWVIVGETRSLSCPNPETDFHNAWIIRKL